jgi:hypothetical protein
VNREDSGDEEEEKEKKEEEENNTLTVDPSISSSKTIPKIFAIISAAIG